MAGRKDCSGCLNKLNGSPFVQCSRCHGNYHLSCVNISQKDYDDMPNDLRFTWICVMCRSKERKGGDNSNTPVRSISSPQHEYVTQRAKPRPANCSCLSASSIRDIIREELQNSFKLQVHPRLTEVQNAITSLEQSMSKFKEELDNVRAVQLAQTAQLESIKLENDSLKAVNQSLSSRLAQLDQQSRSSNIEIQCLPENKQENLINTIQQLGKVIKYPISDAQIHYCSRLAKMNSTSPRPRSILVKFSSPRIRDEFLAATSKFNKNNQNDKLNTSHLGIGGNKKGAVYVVEHLTPENKSLHAAARSKAKELKYKFVWVRDGRIFMRKNEQSNYNVRGLRTKTIELYNNVICNDFDVIVFTETWLNGSVLDSELFDNRYEVFEMLLCPILSWHFKQLVLPEQHGFIAARSTTTNLTSFINDLAEGIDSGHSFDVIYTDFSKAFDSVNHELLLWKLLSIGISVDISSATLFGQLRQMCEYLQHAQLHPVH
ncbi:uncharacterized protein [Epargyreus clarus]|uniref:uncharacterized protein n=1 Tax=Epargyreus clarus TaxID=520877 RepID=UPI003C2EE510